VDGVHVKVVPVASPVMIATVIKLDGSPCFKVMVTGEPARPPVHASWTGWPAVMVPAGAWVKPMVEAWARATMAEKTEAVKNFMAKIAIE